MRDDVTVILCTHDARDKSLLARARESVEGKARILLADNGPHGQRRCHWAWWGQIYEATTPLIALLFDDDWWEPDYLDTLCPELADPFVAYTWSDALIHFPDGTTRPNFYLPAGRHEVPRDEHLMMLLSIPYSIATDCIVMRRHDALTCLLPGGTPLGGFQDPLGGVDGLFAMLPLLRPEYDKVIAFGGTRVHLGADMSSTTIAAMADPEADKRLRAGYKEARAFMSRLAGLA